MISDPAGLQADGDAVKKKPAEAATAGYFRQRQESLHVTNQHFGENREKPDRITANDLTRHDQMVVHREIKRLEQSGTNINYDWQATHAGQKECAVRKMQMT